MIGFIAVGLAALAYAALGVIALARPGSLLGGFGIVVPGADGRNEIRAVYGGFPLAVAGLLVFAMFAATGWRQGILIALAVASLGMAAGRLISAAIDGGIGGYPARFVIIELLLAGAIALGAWA